MIVRKYTEGYVCQTFDTETGKCLIQKFTVDNKRSVQVVDEKDKDIYDAEYIEEINKLHHPFNMEQPGD